MLHQLTRKIETVGMSELDKAVIKATFFDDNPPKEKHVISLIDDTNTTMRSLAIDILDGLARRVRSDKWQVVLKTEIVVHRILREGGAVFAERFARDPSFLDLRSFMDESGGQAGWGMSKFVGRYGSYLIQKSITFGSFDFAVERRIQAEGTDWIKAFDEKKLFKLGGFVQKQFDAALECEIEVSGFDVHPIASCAYIQMLKDSFYLYTFQSILIYYILDRFQKWPREIATQALEFYRRFIVLNTKFKAWSRKAVSVGLIETDVLPDFDAIPTKIVDTLALYLEAGGDQQVKELSDVVDEKLVVDKGTKKKKSKKSKKKVESEDEEEEEEQDDEEEEEEEEKPKKSKSKSKPKKTERPASRPDDGMEDLLGIAAPNSNTSNPASQKQKPANADPFQGLFS